MLYPHWISENLLNLLGIKVNTPINIENTIETRSDRLKNAIYMKKLFQIISEEVRKIFDSLQSIPSNTKITLDDINYCKNCGKIDKTTKNYLYKNGLKTLYKWRQNSTVYTKFLEEKGHMAKQATDNDNFDGYLYRHVTIPVPLSKEVDFSLL